jgi:hypothetical protein
MDAADVEDETILSTIFKDAFPESLRDNAEFGHYLAELSSYGVKRLCREPDRLAEERAQILEQTQDLAFHNYKTFIQTADCCKEIFQDFQIIEKDVDSVLVKLPELNKACDVFIKQAHEINHSRRTNNLTLQKHAQLLEILEIPQVMDTCVRNGYYDEALELAAHVKRLEKKHAATIPIIASIVTEVKSSTQLMLTQLIHQLRTNIQLPACLRVIGYLRRMDVFSEAELRIKFLQARDAWFQSVLASISAEDSYHHISKTVEASRVHLFDIITQYRAIFTDDDLLLSVSDDRTGDSNLFHGWVVQKVSQFLQTLEHDLNLGIGGRLDSVLGQCMYFGLSFSRVGADFRGLLAPIFQNAALSGFIKSVRDANNRLDEMMQSYTLLGTGPMTSSGLFGLSSQSGASLQPPLTLLEFTPLAVYCNALLSAFNDLRLCVPLSLACDVASEVDASLCHVVKCIVAYHRVDEDTFTPQESERFAQMCKAVVCELVPYLDSCLHVLFPPAQLLLVLGVSGSELNKMGKIGTVDIEGITEPLRQFVATVSVHDGGVDAADTTSLNQSIQSSELVPVHELMSEVVPLPTLITNEPPTVVPDNPTTTHSDLVYEPMQGNKERVAEHQTSDFSQPSDTLPVLATNSNSSDALADSTEITVEESSSTEHSDIVS